MQYLACLDRAGDWTLKAWEEKPALIWGDCWRHDWAAGEGEQMLTESAVSYWHTQSSTKPDLISDHITLICP